MGNQCCQQQKLVTYELDVSSKIRQQDYRLVQFPADDIFLQNKIAQHQQIQKLKIYKHLEVQKYYSGEWKQGSPQGTGFLYRPKNYFYYGKFNMKPNQYGEIELLEQGLKYKGQINNGKAEGKGTLTHINNLYFYQGSWKNSQPVTGMLIIHSNQQNSGKTIVNFNQFPIGQTKIQYPDDRQYIGIINQKSLLPDGRGKVIYKNGSSYEGQWAQGHFHGQGVYKWADGTFYEGTYQNGKKHGDGKYMYPSHNIYQGEWLQGHQHGIGSLISSRGDIIKKGVWKRGKYLTSQQV